ncbi:MAG: thioredoxin [Thermoplasmatota archaeon]
MSDEADPELEALRKKKAQQLEKMLKTMEEKKMWPSSPIHISDMEFQETISRYPVVLLDFWAEWCMPCKMIGPILDGLAGEFQGKAVIAKMDVDQNRATPGAFKVRGIPTLVVFKDGKPVERVTGAMGKEAFRSLLIKYTA